MYLFYCLIFFFKKLPLLYINSPFSDFMDLIFALINGLLQLS